jgi:LuxR family maltose regulon positive regulatory protein
VEELLSTKLFIPSTRSELVSRPRLIKRLNEGLGRKLTLISAPAGFGKTTLVSEWVAECGKSVAWLSLEQGDNVLVRFLIYLIATLQTVDPKLASAALNQLQSSQPPPVETTLTSLINAVATLPDKVILILDDYHLIETESIHDGLSFLLENLPPQLHLVIITREDPLLPLSRLRARGQMTELRAADLRFTPQEAAEFLNQVMGLNLSFENVSALESRTEGWIAGLQLAAISLQEKENTTELIKSFSGSHRLVLDYLIEEVLTQQSEHIRSFLLRTSILNHLTGPLCNALTGGNDGQEVLESLDRANLFIVPLDEERRWYRYHHLFVSLLRQRLHQEHHELVSELHQRAPCICD